MLIPCPWCGLRSQIEFTNGGDATLRRPATDASEAAWAEYVYLRDNPCGPHDELWYHGAGCRSWFKVRRDTRTHEILASAPVTDPLDNWVTGPLDASSAQPAQ
ncbi:MAG TPA: sarcosine oxidase subunit delta [Casimicrobiaceae bacterium]|nr:sarcosine oxidase subunit delta [Casimicrobiaceae bacterium]